MIHGLTFKEYIEEEKQKFGEMTNAEKWSYFKDYYLKLCIVGFIGFVLLMWFLIDTYVSMRHVIVEGGCVNLTISDEGAAYMSDEYMALLGASKLTNQVGFAQYIFLDDEDFQSYTIFNAEIATNTYNYLITDRKGLDYLLQIESLADLETTLDSDLKTRTEGMQVKEKMGESKKEITAALDITDTAFAKEYITSDETVYFIITGKDEEYKAGLDVLRYILDKE